MGHGGSIGNEDKEMLSLSREKGDLMMASGFLYYQGTGGNQFWSKENPSRGQKLVR